MMIKINTSVLNGLAAQSVEVEVQVQNGLPRFSIIGLADNAVKESRERVLAALTTAGYSLPDQILINLAPAEIRKGGVAMDLAIGVGVAAAGGIVPAEATDGIAFVGELGLDGSIRTVRGTIAHAVLAQKQGKKTIVVPLQNAQEASLISGIKIIGATHVQEVVQWLCGDLALLETKNKEDISSEDDTDPFEFIIGQDGAKRAMEVAIAGGHHLLMVGPPGCGKTMLARAAPKLLPRLSHDERLEVIGIHSVAAQPIHSLLRGIRPFRSPHYGISEAGLIGGGSNIRPGEISFAHRGVLFLDEFPEYSRSCLEALRIPLEHGGVTVSRARESVHLPAAFQLIAAMNPCPCGTTSTGHCSCSEVEKQRYMKKLSQPILDRIDIHAGLQAVPLESLMHSERSVSAKSKLMSTLSDARSLCLERYDNLPANLAAGDIQKLDISEGARRFIEKAAGRAGVSARGLHKIIKVALTIATLRNGNKITEEDVGEAFGLRLR